MKRCVVLFLALLLLCACAAPQEPLPETNFLFYYRTKEISYGHEEGVISAEAVTVDPTAPVKEVLEQYIQGPVSENLIAAVPETWSLHICYVDREMAVIFFDDSDETSPLVRTIANACIAKTLLQLENIQRVSITMLGESQTQVLTAQDVLLTDMGSQTPQEEITLYFPDADYRYLQRETQTVQPMSAKEKAEYIARQLLTQEEGGKLRSGIPEGTELLGITQENGVCTLNLSGEFVTGMESSFAAERMAVYSFVNSLTELPEIETVDFWISGAPLERLKFLDLTAGLVRDETMITSAGWDDQLDATIYPVINDSGLLAAIPRRINLASDAPIERQILETLLSYVGTAGISNPVPRGTQILFLQVESGVCTVDFNGALLDNCVDDAQRLIAIRSVVATLTALPEIYKVEIFVEGIAPTFLDAYTDRLRSPSKDWFAE